MARWSDGGCESAHDPPTVMLLLDDVCLDGDVGVSLMHHEKMTVSSSSAVFSTLIMVDVTRNHFHSFGSSRKQLSVQQLIHIYEISQIHCVSGFSLKTHADAVAPNQILNLIKVSEKLHLISRLIDTRTLPVKHLLPQSNQRLQHRRARGRTAAACCFCELRPIAARCLIPRKPFIF